MEVTVSHHSSTLSCLLFLGLSTSAFAQNMSKPKSDFSSSRGNSNDFAISLPLALYGESVARVEFNLGHQASLALEGNFKRRNDDISEKDAEESHESLITDAKGALILISRYSEPSRLAGFYWSLGLGFRSMNADWQVQPDPTDKKADLSLTATTEDGSTEVFHHRATMTGSTGHLRGGYRYVSEEFPFMFGIYMGIRHFQASLKDTPIDGSERDGNEPVYASMTERERERLKRRYMTQLEPAIELGFIF